MAAPAAAQTQQQDPAAASGDDRTAKLQQLVKSLPQTDGPVCNPIKKELSSLDTYTIDKLADFKGRQQQVRGWVCNQNKA